MSQRRRFLPHFERYVFAGLLTLAPLWVTWLVFNFLLTQLSSAGRPLVGTLALHPWLESALAVVVTLAALYLLGWTTTRVLGRRLLLAFDALLARVPFAKAVYRMTKQLIETLQTRPEGVKRVVLLRFPHKDIKTVGFVTRVLDDPAGRQIAAVYVPTAPNPTSGYMELVPVEDLIATDWTVEEAMRFVITGGAGGPAQVNYEGADRP